MLLTGKRQKAKKVYIKLITHDVSLLVTSYRPGSKAILVKLHPHGRKGSGLERKDPF